MLPYERALMPSFRDRVGVVFSNQNWVVPLVAGYSLTSLYGAGLWPFFTVAWLGALWCVAYLLDTQLVIACAKGKHDIWMESLVRVDTTQLAIDPTVREWLPREWVCGIVHAQWLFQAPPNITAWVLDKETRFLYVGAWGKGVGVLVRVLPEIKNDQDDCLYILEAMSTGSAERMRPLTKEEIQRWI